MKTCISCKHWEVSQEKRRNPALKYGVCMCWKMNSDIYYNSKHHDRHATTDTDVAFASGYGGVPLYIETGPEFGCIHHESQ